MRFSHLFKTHSALIVILLVYMALATAHSFVAPLATGNDEWAHFLYVRFIAEHGRLPETVSERTEAGYKSDAPALYHLMTAALTAGIEPTRRLRPLDAPRRYLADDVVASYALVHTAVEQPPYRGEVLIWRLGRLFSIVWGAGLISLTYMTGRQIFPEAQARRAGALAAAFVAFTPAILFHSSVLSYESLSAGLTALFLLVALKALLQPELRRWWILLGLLVGLAVTTKYSAVLLPLEAVFVAWLSFKAEPGREFQLSHFVGRLLMTGLAAMLASSWWFGWVAWHFNTIEIQGPLAGVLQPLLVGDASDTTSVKVAGLLFGQDGVEGETRPPLARHYPLLLISFLESFWAAPVAGQVVGTPWLPLLFTVAAMLGLIKVWPLWRQAGPRRRAIIMLLLLHAGLILPLLLIRIALSFDPREAAQGRHLLLPAASAIAILLAWGWERWSFKMDAPIMGASVVGGLLLWSLSGQLGWATLVYPPPLSVWPAGAIAPGVYPLSMTSSDSVLLDSIHLSAARWQQRSDGLEVTLWWQAVALMSEDYLIELALQDESGGLVGYSLGHPLQGRYPTRAWEPGDTIQDTHRLPLAQASPGAYRLQLRLLDRTARPVPAAQTISLGQVTLSQAVNLPDPCVISPAPGNWLNRRALRPGATFRVVSHARPMLRVAGDPAALARPPLHTSTPFHIFMVGPDWPASAQLFVGDRLCGDLDFDIPARNFDIPDIPTPLVANFKQEIELLGYELPTRRIQPGQRLPLTLYWRALDTIGDDYRLFANPLDEQQRRRGGYDRRPRDGYSTLRWVPGEVIIDPFGIPIEPDAPPGIYTIDFGFYRETEAGAEALPLVEAGQTLDIHSIRLGPIKVGGPPPEVVVSQARPQMALNQTLGGQITLLGYDLTDEAGRPLGDASTRPTLQSAKAQQSNLQFTFYWQAETTPGADYTVFLHLRDAANHNVTQQDNPPVAGRYPTSLWDAGEIIVDQIRLPIDGVAAGRYTPVVGLYNFATGERLPVPGRPANEISLKAVTLP